MSHQRAHIHPSVAIYARQSIAEDQGIRQQLDDCRSEAKRRGWPVIFEFVDNDTSGSTQRGPKTDWAKMLQSFDAGKFDTLLVTETSRLTRSLTDVLDVSRPTRDMRIIVIREGIDTEEDDYLLKQLVLLAEREVKIKGQRARRYALERRKAGHPSAGKTPHGYQWIQARDRDAQGTRYRIDKQEAEEVKRIFSEFLAGASLGQIARDLNGDGRRTRSGAKWINTTVRRILMNPMYAGLLPPAQPSGEHDISKIVLEECIPGAWEPIIDQASITATRSRLVGVKPNHQGTARKWLLSGLAICSVCSEPVRSARGETHPTARVDGSGKAESKRYHAYRCVNGHFMRNGDIIDELVKEVCIARLSRPDALKLLAPRKEGPDIGVLNTQRAALETKEETIASLIAKGKMTPGAAEAALDELASQRRSINDEIARIMSVDPLAEVVGSSDVRAWWESATLARRRSVIKILMTVLIKRVGPGKRVTTIEAAAETVVIDFNRND